MHNCISAEYTKYSAHISAVHLVIEHKCMHQYLNMFNSCFPYHEISCSSYTRATHKRSEISKMFVDFVGGPIRLLKGPGNSKKNSFHILDVHIEKNTFPCCTCLLYDEMFDI